MSKKQKEPQPPELPDFKDGRDFEALGAADKEKAWDYYERRPNIPRSGTRAATVQERARFNRIRRKAGRPKIGQGAKVVAVTLEQGLLKRVDAYAKRHAMKRAEMISRALKLLMGEAP